MALVADLRRRRANRRRAARGNRGAVRLDGGRGARPTAVKAAVLAPLGRPRSGRCAEAHRPGPVRPAVVCGGEAPATALAPRPEASTVYDPARGTSASRSSRLESGSPASSPERAPFGWPSRREVAGLGPPAAAFRQWNGEPPRPLHDVLIWSGAAGPRPCRPPTATGGTRARSFVCFCEDVSAKDIHRSRRGGLRLDRAVQAIHDGHDGSMPGPHVPAAVDPADGASRPPQPSKQVGTTTARPPWSAVPLAALAGRPIEPAKRSSIQAATSTSAPGSSGPVTGSGPTTTATRGEAMSVHDAPG